MCGEQHASAGIEKCDGITWVLLESPCCYIVLNPLFFLMLLLPALYFVRFLWTYTYLIIPDSHYSLYHIHFAYRDKNPRPRLHSVKLFLGTTINVPLSITSRAHAIVSPSKTSAASFRQRLLCIRSHLEGCFPVRRQL